MDPSKKIQNNQNSNEYVYPTEALQNQENVLTEQQVQQWQQQGYVLVDNVLPKDLVEQVNTNALDVLEKLEKYTDFGSNGKLEFPTEDQVLNSVTLHPRLLKSVKQLLNSQNIKLVQSDIWKKTGVDYEKLQQGLDKKYLNYDQRIHMDFPNHYLTHPPVWDKVEAVEMIIYYSDVEQTGGSTKLVPRNGKNDPAYKYPYENMPGFGNNEWINDKQSAEENFQKNNTEIYNFRQELYKREKSAYFKPGTILFYRYDTWHRGTPVNPGITRVIQNLAFKLETTESWITQWNQGWARSMYTSQQVLEKLIAQLTVDQRNVIGFPHPNSKYWNKDTLLAVKKRYECFGFDIKPYLEAQDIEL